MFYFIQFIVLKDILTASSHNTQNVHFQELKVTRLLLDGEICYSLNISFASGSSMQPINYTDEIQRCLDSFFRKRSPLKLFVKRNWKIEKNNKEEVQFKTLQKALVQRVYEERKNFPPKIKKGIHLVAVW